ncbi:MAG: 3',5'-cyclic-nucleotide phosphodiesterase [Chlamydiales bacterium]
MSEVFQVIVMGCTGGPFEGNLSGYLLSPIDKTEWIALDAGTLLSGIHIAILKNHLDLTLFSNSALTPAGEMLLEHIKAFLISHAHLDHIAGLILNSQIDTSKYILGTDSTIDHLRDHIFNGEIWPNYGSEGSQPILGKYQYVRLPLFKTLPIPNTTMQVESYLLNHPGGYPSTAFLIEYQGNYLLYVGDTSSDALEGEKHLTFLWKRIAPLIERGQFKGMFLESSYSQNAANKVLFGHLNPKLTLLELHRLASFVDTSLEELKIIITHCKESIRQGEETQKIIKKELTDLNDLGVQFIFPEQGDRILL